MKFISKIVAASMAVAAGATLLVSSNASTAAPALAFEAQFATASDFYDRFDYGFSGLLDGVAASTPIHGDHNMACDGPTTMRDVNLPGGQLNTNNYAEMFWHCAPGADPEKGHMMTGMTTFGYDHLWFSPKAEFSNITKVCWDQNMNTIGGKWLELQFVDNADATRYPTGTITMNGGAVARGSGGFDLGYTDPEFRDPGGPHNGIFPQSGTLAGLRWDSSHIFQFFQNQDQVTASQVGWPGLHPAYNGGVTVTDKATRYKQCVENISSTQIRVTGDTPVGQRILTMNGQIPQNARRIVFHDSEYDGPKRGFYNPDNVTWHWDNIQVFTDDGGVIPPTTTTLPPTTTTTTTTLPPTTTTTTTTLPPTTTTTTTTLPPTTTTTVAPTTTLPALVCPGSFNTQQRNWCEQVNARIMSLEARVKALGG